MPSPALVGRAISFGPFHLLPEQQLLLEGETSVRLGSRALEILIALVERPGELVSKSELMARVWPNSVVEESNLKVHIAALRRTLGDGQPGRRFLTSVPGRGYRFVAPVTVSDPPTAPAQHNAEAERTHNLPTLQTRTVGRSDTIGALLNQLPQRRFITIVGMGGIGKSTVALAVADASIGKYQHGVHFVDLSPLSDERLVPSALAAALGLSTQSRDLVSAVLAYLRDKQMLILLDSCEHVAGGVAALAEQLLNGAPAIHVLATSREPLRAEGERVHRLSPLAIPPDGGALTASEALAFSAVQLFVERAAASVDGFELTDADAPIIADICRKLDGIALAIELAATRIDAFGVRQLAVLLDDRFRILKQGRRTALPRHQTLTATFDWSYALLPEHERVVLLRLSVFAGAFTLDAANAVIGDSGADVVETVASLVAKSLISPDVSGAVVRYRLLDTTRAYAVQKLIESGDFQTYVRRHAEYYRDLFERAAAEWEARPTADWLADYGSRLDDVRSALSWAFSPDGDPSVGIALTVSAIPLWIHFSLMDECRAHVEWALKSAEAARSKRDEMKLYVALGTALPYARGPLPETGVVWTKALQLAETLDDNEYQLRAIWGLCVYRMYIGDHRGTLNLAEKFCDVATKEGDIATRLIGDRLTGTTLYFLGEHGDARRRLERMLSQYIPPVHRSHITRFQFDHRVAAQATLSNILWMQGFPDQAVRSMQVTLDRAYATNHALSLCNALAHAACPISLYVGDWAEAERLVTMLQEHSAKHALAVWNAGARCLKGALLVARGDIAGIALLRTALDELHEAKLGFRYAGFLGDLAQGFSAAGQMAEARMAIDKALDQCNRSEERWCIAELLRIKGNLLQLNGTSSALAAAEDHYRQALTWARKQEALSWELRAATSLANLWHKHGKTSGADELLSSVYDRFSEGFETADLKTARALITKFRTETMP
jgi:predicted ATPase/DNA-binding winged helix-turn-helix (wHTH) protein